MSITFAELRQANVQRCRSAFPECDDWTSTDWATAVAGEVGEACNLIKKSRRGERIDENDIADELADAVIYLDLLASHLGVRLEDAIIRKFNVVSDRRQSSVRL